MIRKISPILILLLLSVCIADQSKSTEGNDAPTFFLTTIDGKKFFLSDELKSGNPIFLNFFATWCKPCIKELPDISYLKDQYKNISFYLINVSNLEINGDKMKENPKEVLYLLDRLNIDIPVLMDKYALVAKKYNAIPLPKTVIIDRKGRIRYSQNGIIDNTDKDFLKALNLQ